MSLRIVISAGEVSGDRHLARVLRALLERNPGCQIRGMGGRECRETGADLLVDCYRTGATMGFAEILRSLTKIWRSFKTMSELIKEWRPDLLVLVDYPDFNLRLAKVAHKHGVKVLYYIPPKVWAWRSGRIKTISENIDHVATIFPFERPFFAKHGYDSVSYVGNPLADRIATTICATGRHDSLLLLPGSRKFEVERILPPMLRVFERLRRARPELTARVVVAPNMDLEQLRAWAGTIVAQETFLSISWTQKEALDEMRSARAGILKSGTCNLEGAIAGLPFVSVYSGSVISKVIASTLVRLKEYSPVNIMQPGSVREVFGVTIDEQELERAVALILDDGAERDRVLAALNRVRDNLRGCDASLPDLTNANVAQRVAYLIEELSKRSSNCKVR